MLLAMTSEEWVATDKTKYVNSAVFKISPEYIELMELLDKKFNDERAKIKTNTRKEFWMYGTILPIYNEKKKLAGLSPMILNLPLVHLIKEVEIQDNITSMFYDSQYTAEQLLTIWNTQYAKYKQKLLEGVYNGKLIIINKRRKNDSWATLLWPLVLASITVLVTENGLIQYKLPAHSRLMNGIHRFLSEDIMTDIQVYNTVQNKIYNLPTAAFDVLSEDANDVIPTNTSIFKRALPIYTQKWLNIWSPTISPSSIETWTFDLYGKPIGELDASITLGAIVYNLIDTKKFETAMELNMVENSVIHSRWAHRFPEIGPALMSYAALSPSRANMVDRFLSTIDLDTSNFIWESNLTANFGYADTEDDLLQSMIKANMQFMETDWYYKIHKEFITEFGIAEYKYAPWIPPHLAVTNYHTGDTLSTSILHDTLIALQRNYLAWILYQIIATAFNVYPTNLSQLNAFMSLNFGIGRSETTQNNTKFLLKPWYCNIELVNQYKLAKKYVAIPEAVKTEINIKRKPL